MKNNIKNIAILSGILLICPALSFTQNVPFPGDQKALTHHEVPDNPYLAPVAGKKGSVFSRPESGGFFTVQVNVDADGNNITGDAANEPSIAVDPTNPDHMVIGWRQFDNVSSNFRQAGYGFSADGGQTWTFPGVIEPMVFRSDPVLDFDSSGVFYYNSLTYNNPDYTCKVFKSADGGAVWDAGTSAHGGDKQWMAIDRTGLQGIGNIYSFWTSIYSSCYPGFFTRSTNGGADFEDCMTVSGNPFWGTMAIGPSGELYIGGSENQDGIRVSKSVNAQIPGSAIYWNLSTHVDMDGYLYSQSPINPEGLVGQVSIDVDCSDGPGHGNVYVLASVARYSTSDPADVMFARSTNGGQTWSVPQRINTDQGNTNYQWFGTMSVAPNGRIDVVWLDTRDAPPGTFFSALYYCYSINQGETWSINKKLSDSFDPTVGYPMQNKMGDYFDMISDDEGAHLAWANTLNGEQDVYYTHIIPQITGIEEGFQHQDLLSLSAYPNPFYDQAAIRYTLGADGPVDLVICDLYGKTLATLVHKEQKAGAYSIRYAGEELSSGFYFCRLTSGVQARTISLVKINR